MNSFYLTIASTLQNQIINFNSFLTYQQIYLKITIETKE